MTGEDPFLWRDPRNDNLTNGTVLHMLRHVGRDTRPGASAGNNGGHQFSTDEGRSWSACVDNCTTAYPGHIEFDDGTVGTFMMRERPHLVFANPNPNPNCRRILVLLTLTLTLTLIGGRIWCS
jgi:hypothetical protein